MATSTIASAMAIMSHPSVRAADVPGTALAAFSPDLSLLLWANSAGARLLGLSQPDGSGAGADASPAILRQIRAAAGIFARNGRAATTIRPLGTGLGRPLSGEITRISLPEFGDCALLAVYGIAGTGAVETGAERDVRLARESAAEALLDLDGRIVGGTDDPAVTPADAEPVRAFAASQAAFDIVTDAEGRRFALSRIADDRIALRAVADAEAPRAPQNAAADEAVAGSTGATLPTDDDPQPAADAPGRRVHSNWSAPPPEDDTAAGGPAASEAETDAPSAEAPPSAFHAAAGDPVAEKTAGAPAGTGGEVTAGGPGSDPVASADEADGNASPQLVGTIVLPDTLPEWEADDDAVRAVTAADFPPAESDASDQPDGTDPEAGPGDGAFIPRFDVQPARFVWRIDSAGRFRSLSPEFALAVGPTSAAVLDRSFAEVAQAYGLDPEGSVQRLLERRDTWSGRTVFWPVENSAMTAPVDLAALPVYARDRSFDGFRGFGIVRLGDAVVDPAARGRRLDRLQAGAGAALGEGAAEAAGFAASPDGAAQPFLRRVPANLPEVQFGRRDPADRPDAPAPEEEGPSDEEARNIIRLEERRRSKEGTLSQAEEDAFRAIGQRLADRPGPRDLGEAIRAASERIAAIEESRGRDAESDVDTAEPGDSDESDSADGAAAQENRPGLPAPAQQPGREPSAEAEMVAGAADAAPVPATNDAAAPSQSQDGSGEGADDAAGAGGAAQQPDGPGELERIYGFLPIPILVQSRDEIAYANREFLDLTGYPTSEAIRAAGGLGALFCDPGATGDSAGMVTLLRANGDRLAVRAHLQRATIAGRSSLVMSFFASPRLCAAALGHVLSETPAAAPAPAAADDAADPTAAELAAVLDMAADGVLLLDDNGGIRAMNGAAHRLFGIAEDDAAGRPFAAFFAHESQKAVRADFDLLRAGGAAEETDGGRADERRGAGREVIGRVAEGGFVPLAVRLERLPDGRGYCAVIRDITPWKRAEEDLTRARQEAEAASLHKSAFLASVSHELRTPLNAIVGFADVMAAESLGPIENPRYLEYLEDIKRSGHQVLDLVNELLDISKIETGRLELAFEAVSLTELIAEVAAVTAPQANRQRVILRTHLPSSVPPVVADRASLRQVAINLVGNAIRSTPAGGQLIVSARYAPEEGVTLRFRDSGVGLREDEIEAVMRPFHEAHQTARRSGESGRFALPLTKAMVEANRASFALSSTPGEGTLIEIVFPPARILAD
ncbi:histidine kinase dimerization/phospho-acceptor domain-containing protein [Jiella sp. M17.18]|uniref:histidine kinase dimerization/phospho-acceptor domain-containing protein n=1 Tax=Jiella sp. M17.18 TaxID=3234247 RepID=UPI0034DEEC7B